jgi:hypothetical protein
MSALQGEKNTLANEIMHFSNDNYKYSEQLTEFKAENEILNRE